MTLNASGAGSPGIDRRFDWFVSYATEDAAIAQSVADALSAAGRTVFFAPVALRQAGGAIHESLLSGVQRSDNLVVVWTQSAHHSAWVALELSTHATLRQLHPDRYRGVVALDLEGPPRPSWLTVDETYFDALPATIAPLANQVREAEREVRATPHQPTQRVWSPIALTWSVCVDHPAWNRRVRGKFGHLVSRDAFSHFRAADFQLPAARDLVSSAATAIVLWPLLGLILALLIVGVARLPTEDMAVRNAIMCATAAAVTGAILSLRASVAAGVAAAALAGTIGPMVAVLAVLRNQYGEVPGGFTAGLALGAAGTVFCLLPGSPSGAVRVNRSGIRVLLTIAVSVSLSVVLAVGYGALIGEFVPNPPLWGRALLGFGFGVLVGMPLFFMFWVVTRKQVRVREWPATMRIVGWAWLGTALLSSVAAALVPLAKPYDPRDGVGAGMLVGLAASTVPLMVHHGLDRWRPSQWTLPAGIAFAIVTSPLLLALFENIKRRGMDAVYGVLLGALTGAIVLRASIRFGGN